jgi:hypothetical protein
MEVGIALIAIVVLAAWLVFALAAWALERHEHARARADRDYYRRLYLNLDTMDTEEEDQIV